MTGDGTTTVPVLKSWNNAAYYFNVGNDISYWQSMGFFIVSGNFINRDWWSIASNGTSFTITSPCGETQHINAAYGGSSTIVEGVRISSEYTAETIPTITVSIQAGSCTP